MKESETNSQISSLGWGFGLCNMNCKHCYNSSNMACDIPRYTFFELKTVADKVCSFINDINFGTGEFSVNPGTVELAEYIADYYPSVDMALTSNGWSIIALQPSKVKRLFHDIDISLDFPSAEHHNQFRRNPKAWQWAMDGLETLRDIRVSHSIVTCVTSKTSEEDILGLLDFAKRFDSAWRINWFRKAGRGRSELKLSAERAWEIINFLSDKVTFQCLDSIFAEPLGLPCTPCPAGHQSARIHQDMSVTAYPFLKGQEWTAGNILEEGTDLQTIYNSPAFSRLRKRDIPECYECQFWQNCRGGCVTRAALHNGGIDKRDDYCPIAANINLDVISLKMQRTKDFLIHEGYLCTTICWPE